MLRLSVRSRTPLRDRARSLFARRKKRPPKSATRWVPCAKRPAPTRTRVSLRATGRRRQ